MFLFDGNSMTYHDIIDDCLPTDPDFAWFYHHMFVFFHHDEWGISWWSPTVNGGPCKALGLPNGNVDRAPRNFRGTPVSGSKYIYIYMDSQPEYLDWIWIHALFLSGLLSYFRQYVYWYWDTLGSPSKQINKFGMSQYPGSHTMPAVALVHPPH